MNGFNKTEAAVFSSRLCFLRAFPYYFLLCTAGVQSPCGGCKKSPVLHIIVQSYFSGSQGSWSVHVGPMLFTFENGVPLMRQGVIGVASFIKLLMNGFNKTEAAVFSCRLCFLGAFPFTSLKFGQFSNILFSKSNQPYPTYRVSVFFIHFEKRQPHQCKLA